MAERGAWPASGRLSSRKRASHFSALTDAEVEGLEEAVRQGHSPDPELG